MITLKQACIIVKKLFPKHKIEAITDVGKGWVFGASYGDNDYPLTYVSKETGKSKPFEPTEHYDELENAFNIDVPETYF